MGFWEDRWAQREAERPPAPADQRAGWEAERAAELARLEEELSGVFISTLDTAPRAFEPAGLVLGATCDSAAEALLRLKDQARIQECDAVLGVGICSVARGTVVVGSGVLSAGFLAYGTGVRWTSRPPEEAAPGG